MKKPEKEKPKNIGCVIRLDARERKVYKDGQVIDSLSTLFILDNPQQVSSIKVISWNINSVWTKYEIFLNMSTIT